MTSRLPHRKTTPPRKTAAVKSPLPKTAAVKSPLPKTVPLSVLNHCLVCILPKQTSNFNTTVHLQNVLTIVMFPAMPCHAAYMVPSLS